jgi:hypothetical protein
MSDNYTHPALIETRPSNGGTQRLYKFPNGYGASVIRHAFSYGGPAGFWELAVLDAAGKLTYETPITSDVIGWQTDEQIEDLLRQIEALPTP